MRKKKKPDNMTKWQYRKMKMEENREKFEKAQRIITIARRNRLLSIIQLADMIYVSKSTLQLYESGQFKADWDMLEKVMPELIEMRKHDCRAYCKYQDTCTETGKCIYRSVGKLPDDM